VYPWLQLKRAQPIAFKLDVHLKVDLKFQSDCVGSRKAGSS
jgi:hypothetical protein